jgi:indolepyruvate ferredoxin oxidoreductase
MRIEAERAGGGTSVTETYARGLYKLMAYKDEYEVARLHLDAVERARIADEFGDGAKVQLMLHPPLLRAMGLKRKLKLGAWAVPGMQALRAGKRIRGTRLDVFGYAHVRRVERELIDEYRALVDKALEHLGPETVATVARIADLPDIVRGYEDIKLANVDTFRARAAELLQELTEAPASPAHELVTFSAAG